MSERDAHCYLAYPYLGQHFVNGLAIAAKSLQLYDGRRPIPVTATPQVGGYRSPFALALDAQQAPVIAQKLKAIAQDYLHNKLGEVSITHDDSGWLEMRVSPEILRSSLLHLCQISRTPEPQQSRSSPEEASLKVFQTQPQIQPVGQTTQEMKIPPELTFELQYAHARCCRVVRLSRQTLTEHPSISLNWLESYLQLHPLSAEHELLWQLINFPKGLQQGNQLFPSNSLAPDIMTDQALALVIIPNPVERKRIQAMARDWAALFQKFYGSAQLCPLTLPDSQPLLTLRTALFQALRNLLEFMLTQIFRQDAPQIL